MSARARPIAAALALLACAAGCGGDATREESGQAGAAPAPAASAAPAAPAPSPEDAAALAAAVRAMHEGRYEEVDTLLGAQLAQPSPSPDALFIAGSAAYERDDFALAADRLAQAVRLKPQFLPNAVALGFAQRRLGRADDARATFESIVAARPDGHKAHYGLGLVALEAGDLPAARGHLERALALQPGYLKAQVALAKLLQQEGRLEEARAAFEAVVKRKPAHDEALYRLSQVLVELGRGEEAQSVLEQQRKVYALKEQIGGLLASVRAGTASAASYAQLADLLLQVGEDEQAGQSVSEGLRRFPGDARLTQLRLAFDAGG